VRSIGLGCRGWGWGWGWVLVASGFDDLVGQTGRIRKDQLMAARHLHQPGTVRAGSTSWDADVMNSTTGNSPKVHVVELDGEGPRLY
jgi:hypothetical protein